MMMDLEYQTDQTSPASAVADLPQGRLSYRIAGPASSDRPPVVFVHGLLVDARLWDPVAVRLARQGIRSYAPTLPLGAHRSPMKPGADLSPAGIAGLVGDFIRALGLRDVILVGNDTGGAICQIMLGNGGNDDGNGGNGGSHGNGGKGNESDEGITNRIGAAVLTNCDAFGTFPPLPFAPLIRALRHPRLVACIAPTLRARAVRHGPLAYGPLAGKPLDPGLTLDWTAPLGDKEICRDLAKFARRVNSRILLDAASRFGEFTGQVRILWGEGDPFFKPALGQRLGKAFTNASYTTVPAGRAFLPVDHPDLVASEIMACARPPR